MSTALGQKANPQLNSGDSRRASSGRWILNSWLDLLLFVSTPLLIVPLVLLIQAPWFGVEIATISVIVSTFGGLGHHLPGMIRAYGDRDLFKRFRMRFILAPLFLLAVCIPLSQYHLNAMLLILSVWGCWHALMQVYGFVRIYDARVGCVSSVTAWWDWLMCLSWFSTAQIFSNGKMSRLLEYWYTSGGPLIPPSYVHTFRGVCLAVSVLVLVGFLVNYGVQTSRGQKPNSVKLLMLASSIGFWWFAMVLVEDIILGIALFEIFHDVQYLTIVWLYNCRTASSNPDIGKFMRFVFRRGRGMLMLYIGLVFAYGTIGMFSLEIEGDSFANLIRGVVWASTILHFYYDGFIWKVRDKATRAGLGLDMGKSQPVSKSIAIGEFAHLLKWSPLIIILSWLSITELSGSSFPPGGNAARSWPNQTQLERVQNIAVAIPDDLRAQRRAATTLANMGRDDEAIRNLKSVLQRHPSYLAGQHLLGEIYRKRGEFDQERLCYETAITHAKGSSDQTLSHHRMGEFFMFQKNYQAARTHFREALKHDSTFEPSRSAISTMNRLGDGLPHKN